MGIFGIGKEEVKSDLENKKEDEDIVRKENIVNLVASEAASSVSELETNAQSLVAERDMVVNPEEKKLIETFREIKPMDRRDFLRFAGIFAAGMTLAACAPKQSFRDEGLESTVEAMRPLPTNEIEVDKEYVLKDPVKLNPRDFSIGVEGYPNAIVDRSMFATKEDGEPLFLRYSGGQFNEVTYLHYTGENPYVVGEILPLMYKVPEDIEDKEVSIVPYAISIQSERGKINLNDGKNHYLVPIVTSGNDSGVIPNNGPYKSFEVRPDAVSGNTNGFLSWVVLTEIGNELIVEGITSGKSGIYIDKNNVPEEISRLIGE